MNADAGAYTTADGSPAKGHHGSPTEAESQVPMIWHYSGSDDPGSVGPVGLLPIIREKIEALKAADAKGELRTFRFKEILRHVILQTKEKKP